MNDLGQLAQRLGHIFTTPALLAQALTHSSQSRQHYERLEFLGDRVLGLVIAEWLTELEPVAAEGVLAKRLAALAGRETLAEVALKLELGQYLKLSSSDGALAANPGILADCCEAVIAALYLDGGLATARAFIRAEWADFLESPPEMGDSKTRLQEWSQARGLGLPVYAVVARSGPDHAPSFTIEVTIKGHEPQSASGASKRLAERAAADALLKVLTS